MMHSKDRGFRAGPRKIAHGGISSVIRVNFSACERGWADEGRQSNVIFLSTNASNSTLKFTITNRA